MCRKGRKTVRRDPKIRPCVWLMLEPKAVGLGLGGAVRLLMETPVVGMSGA